MKKLKNVLIWIVFNFTLLGLFIAGNLLVIPTGILNIVIFVYWIFGILGLFYFSKDVALKVFEVDNNWTLSVPIIIDITLDVVVIVSMVYFGYFILPILYLLASFGLHELGKNIKKLQNGDTF